VVEFFEVDSCVDGGVGGGEGRVEPRAEAADSREGGGSGDGRMGWGATEREGRDEGVNVEMSGNY